MSTSRKFFSLRCFSRLAFSSLPLMYSSSSSSRFSGLAPAHCFSALLPSLGTRTGLALRSPCAAFSAW